MRVSVAYLLPLAAAFAAVTGTLPVRATAAPVSGYKVVAEFPHSTSSYTEGFFYRDGLFYEGTGLKGSSAILVIEPETGKVLQRRDLPQQFFGEGIIDWGPDIYEWTWQSHICFIYDRFSLRPAGQFTYSGEGWGMTRTASSAMPSWNPTSTAVRHCGRYSRPRSFSFSSTSSGTSPSTDPPSRKISFTNRELT